MRLREDDAPRAAQCPRVCSASERQDGVTLQRVHSRGGFIDLITEVCKCNAVSGYRKLNLLFIKTDDKTLLL